MKNYFITLAITIIFSTLFVIGTVIYIHDENYIKGFAIVIILTIISNYIGYSKAFYELLSKDSDYFTYWYNNIGGIIYIIVKVILKAFLAITLAGSFFLEKINKINLKKLTLYDMFLNTKFSPKVSTAIAVAIWIMAITTVFEAVIILIKKCKKEKFLSKPLEERLIELKYKNK